MSLLFIHYDTHKEEEKEERSRKEETEEDKMRTFQEPNPNPV